MYNFLSGSLMSRVRWIGTNELEKEQMTEVTCTL